jgi:hypothetical protein
LHVCGQIWPGERNLSERLEADRHAQFVDMFGIGQSPGARDAVPRIVNSLRAETLGPPLMQGDAIFEIGGMPSGKAALRGACTNQF